MGDNREGGTEERPCEVMTMVAVLHGCLVTLRSQLIFLYFFLFAMLEIDGEKKCLDTEGTASLHSVQICVRVLRWCLCAHSFPPITAEQWKEDTHSFYVLFTLPAPLCCRLLPPVSVQTERIQNRTEVSSSEQHTSPQERLRFHLEQRSSSQEKSLRSMRFSMRNTMTGRVSLKYQ